MIALSSVSSLLIHTHCSASLICQNEKVALRHFPGSSQLLGQYFSSGGRETNDLHGFDLAVVIGRRRQVSALIIYMQLLKMLLIAA